MKFLMVFLILVSGTASLPVDERSPLLKVDNLPGEDYDLLDDALDDSVDDASLTVMARVLPGFKYIYIDRNGSIYNDSDDGPAKKLEIAGSPGSSYRALYAAAFVAINMTRHVKDDVFDRLASTASIGIFTKEEKLTVFPEYARYANGNCGSSCSGSCQSTCSGDGRKIENVSGLGGKRAVVLLDNVMCTWRDPYFKKQSIMTHEFTHTIHGRGLTPWWKDRIKEVYQAAKQKGTWNVNSYAMSNVKEYLAEAATVYFGVNKNHRWQAGGMNWCDGRFCATEMEGRQRLNASDPDLFNILTNIFMDGDPTIDSQMTICPDTELLDRYV